MTTHFELSFGAFADPIKEQLHEQGIAISVEDLRHFQADADSIVRLAVRGLLPDSQIRKARQRLIAKIGKAKGKQIKVTG